MQVADMKSAGMGAAPPMVRIDQIKKIYPTRDGAAVTALPGISLDIAEGEFVSVVGPSGCGKTTLLKILAGLIEPTAGTVTVSGHTDTASGTGAKTKPLGVVFQAPVLMPWLTVLDNVLLPARVLKLDIAAATARANELLGIVGLEGFQRQYPGELSGGMQQRVAIVRGLIHQPNVLLMDEPFGALDALTRERMNEELQKIWLTDRKSIFFITHSIPEAVFLSDRIIVMSARPARIVKEFRIPFARPRRMDLLADPAFGAFANEIRQLLGDGDAHL